MPANEEWSDVARIVLLWERLVPLAEPAELYGAFAYPLDIYSCRIVKESKQHRPVARAVAQFLLERARDADDTVNAKRLADNVVAFGIG